MSKNKEAIQLISILSQMGLGGGERIPFLIVGGAGIGKTAMIHGLGEKIAKFHKTKYGTEVWSGPQIQAEDVSGLPVPDLKTGTTRLLPLHVGKSVGVGVQGVDTPCGLIVIDEFGSIEDNKEAAFLNFIQGGRLGELELPSQVALGAIMNPPDIASNARTLSEPASNRFVWIDFFDDMDATKSHFAGVFQGKKNSEGFLDHFVGLPKDWETAQAPTLARLSDLVTSFWDRDPSSFTTSPKGGGEPFATPRSWKNLVRLLGACSAAGFKASSSVWYLAVQGCVGEAIAPKFVAYLRDNYIPSVDELLAATREQRADMWPKDRPDLLSTVINAIRARVIDASESDRRPLFDLLLHGIDDNQVDFEQLPLFMSSLFRAKKSGNTQEDVVMLETAIQLADYVNESFTNIHTQLEKYILPRLTGGSST